jgi:hypothetical protein
VAVAVVLVKSEKTHQVLQTQAMVVMDLPIYYAQAQMKLVQVAVVEVEILLLD